jgi:thioredoxin 1
METYYFKRFALAFIFMGLLISTNYAQSTQKGVPDKGAIKYKVTFIELGSVRCIPCQQMQGVMKSIEKKYGTQVKVVFHDVWTPEGKPFGQQFGIEAIPTQVFLDENGKEFSRHVGFFPEEELIKVLKSNGVK